MMVASTIVPPCISKPDSSRQSLMSVKIFSPMLCFSSRWRNFSLVEYDAWGSCTASTESGTTTIQKQIVRTLNPFRYRRYYYDTDTGLYYLQSRYYNPKWGRFLNADGYVSTGTGLLGYNMYAYCDNNPVMGYDPNGNMIIHNPRMFSTMGLFMKFLYGERSLYAINILYEKM